MRTCNVRKLICTFIAFIATLSVVGTGFCLWVFSDKKESTNIDLSIPVITTQNVENGFYEEKSLITEGKLVDALKDYVFPKMLVFEEGTGLIDDLTKGLNFYKIISNHKGDGGPTDREFTEEAHLRDNVLITFYREASISEKELADGGLKLSLELKITISKTLKNFITVIDMLQSTSEYIYENPNIKDESTAAECFTFDFTKYSVTDENKLIDGNTIVQEHTQFDKTKKYQKYDFNMNFSKIFRYKTIDRKPITQQSYLDLRNLCDTEKNEYLKFDFYSSYKRTK